MQLGLEDKSGYYRRLREAVLDAGNGHLRTGAHVLGKAIAKSATSVERGLRGRWGLHDPILVPRIASALSVGVQWLTVGGFRMDDCPPPGHSVAVSIDGYGQAVMLIVERTHLGVRLIRQDPVEELWVPWPSIRSLTKAAPARQGMLRSSESGRQVSHRLRGVVGVAEVQRLEQVVQLQTPDIIDVRVDVDEVVSMSRQAIACLCAVHTLCRADAVGFALSGATPSLQEQIRRSGGEHLLRRW